MFFYGILSQLLSAKILVQKFACAKNLLLEGGTLGLLNSVLTSKTSLIHMIFNILFCLCLKLMAFAGARRFPVNHAVFFFFKASINRYDKTTPSLIAAYLKGISL